MGAGSKEAIVFGGRIGLPELLIILIILLLLFGGRKIPEIARGLGEGIKSFKDGLREGKTEEKK
jgi:sec-independent protein translocase protein TatA